MEKIKNIKLEKIYFITALVVGILMAFLNPPFAGVPDEQAHYWKAWSIAGGYWRCTGQDTIPKTAVDLPGKIGPVSYPGLKINKIVVAKLKQEFSAKETNTSAVIRGANCSATPFGYIPQAIGLRLGRTIDLPPLVDFYLARILTLLASIALIFYAIRIAPFGKIIFFIIGLLPLTIEQMASLSYDSLQISFALLFFAYVLKMAEEKNTLLKRKDILLLLFLSLFGLSTKLGYFAMSGLILVIPKSKFTNKKKYYTFISLFLLSNVAFYFLLRNTFQEISSAPFLINSSEQLKFVLFAPLHFLNAIFETVYQNGLTNYVAGVLYRTGWEGSVSHWLFVFIFFGIVLFLRNEDEQVTLTKTQRFIIFLIFLVNFILVYLGLYLVWTKVGAEKISGVQGRYLISLLPFFIFIFYKMRPGWNFKKLQENKNIALIIFFTLVYIFVFQAIYQIHYNKKVPGSSAYQRFLNEKQQ